MRRLKPLINVDYEVLDWKKLFKDLTVIRINVAGDGSCFFHAICKAYFKPYIFGKVGDKPLNRGKFVRKLRRDLAKKLGSKINPEDANSKTYYEDLAKGELANIGKEIKQYSLENMQKTLDSSEPISNEYNEFISNQLDIDIYIIDGIKRDVYMTGTEDSLIYKNRKSVILLYLPGHYELIGTSNSSDIGIINTFFDPEDRIIQIIRNRMKELRSE